MVETAAPPEAVAPDGPENTTPRTRMVESVLDNLSMWTVVAVSIGILYLIWATLEILGKYVGGIPKVAP